MTKLFKIFFEFVQFAFGDLELVHAYNGVVDFAFYFAGFVEEFVGEEGYLGLMMKRLPPQFFITFDFPTHIFNLLHVLDVIFGQLANSFFRFFK